MKKIVSYSTIILCIGCAISAIYSSQSMYVNFFTSLSIASGLIIIHQHSNNTI